MTFKVNISATLQSFEMSFLFTYFRVIVVLFVKNYFAKKWFDNEIVIIDYEVVRILKVDGDGDEQSHSEMRQNVTANWKL